MSDIEFLIGIGVIECQFDENRKLELSMEKGHDKSIFSEYDIHDYDMNVINYIEKNEFVFKIMEQYKLSPDAYPDDKSGSECEYEYSYSKMTMREFVNIFKQICI